MISFHEARSNVRAYRSLHNISMHTRQGIRNAFFALGKDLKQTSRRLILDPPKDGRIYHIRRNGHTVKHRASAPGQPPANFTGNLRRSVDYTVNGSHEMRFGAGNGKNVKYARRLELGGKRLEPRPYLKPSIKKNEREAYTRFTTNIAKKICR